jgi:hypothetical protein
MAIFGGCGGGSDGDVDDLDDEASAITVAGPHYSIDGNLVNITGAGDYVVSGALSDGGIVVDAPGEEVRVILSGVTIANSRGPAIFARDASVVTVVVSEGTRNVLSDGGADEDHDAAIFSSVPLVIDGDGDLSVTGNNQEGIASDSTLVVNGGRIRVTAVDDGLNSGEGIVIDGGYIFVDADGDGIDSNAHLTINGGTVISHGGAGDGGLDVDDGFRLSLNGGLIIATGDSNARPDESSAQKYMLLNFATSQASGTIIHIEKSDGTEVVTFSPHGDYREFLFSSGGLSAGVSYSVYSGGTSGGYEQDGLYTGGSYGGGARQSHFDGGSADESFVISGAGGVFNLGEGQPDQGSPGGPQPSNGLPPRDRVQYCFAFLCKTGRHIYNKKD